MIKTIFVALAVGALAVGAVAMAGCQTTSTAPARTQIIDAISGGARGSRDDARALKRQSDERLAARNYLGAMDARWQMLDIRSKSTSMLGALTAFAIQSLALGDLAPIVSHLDAAACRRYAARLKDFDARSPTYTVLLERQKADALSQIRQLTRDPQEWQKTVAGLRFSPQERQTLQKTPGSQIEKNIEKIYQAAQIQSKKPYSNQPINISVDAYTKIFASPSELQKFIVAKYRTDRLLIVAALQKRADRLEKKTSESLPLDPFGSGPFKVKGDLIYSVGPDAKDDGGRTVPVPTRAQPTDKGDIPAPIF